MEDLNGNVPGAADSNTGAGSSAASTENNISVNETTSDPNTEITGTPVAADVEVPKIDKMIAATNEFLERHNAKGIDDEIGNYEPEVIKAACQNILNGSVHADTGYGIIMSRLYFETANLI